MAFAFLICPDSDLLLEQARALVPEGWSLRTFWAESPLPERYWQALTALPLGEAGCAVLLRQAHLAGADDWARLDGLLRRDRPGIQPLFALEVEWERKKPKLPKAVRDAKCFAAARKRHWVWEDPGLDPARALERAKRLLAAAGKALTREAERQLAPRLPLRLAAIANEMAKLALAAGDAAQVTPEHLAVLAGEERWDVFALVQAALTPAKLPELWRQLRRDPQMASGDATFLVMALLRREARILWSLARGEEPGEKVPAWALGPKQAMAKRLGPVGIARLFGLLAEAETAIKSGQQTPAQALEWLLTAIGQP